jgi:hypothetical protein
MPTSEEQSFAKHARWDPVFHFITAPIALLTVLGSIVHAWRHFGIWNVWLIVVAITATVMLTRLRMYSLMVQDRVIRLEERLRLSSLCGEPLRSRIPELSVSQLIALRFASDAEAAALAERALTSNLTSKQIKEAIQVWRPDHQRV